MPARALDLFTLWRQPQIPLRFAVGLWADYQTVRLEGGQRTEEVTRVQCVGRAAGPDGAWQLEVLRLDVRDHRRVPVAGEGWSLELSSRVERREGDLAGLIGKVVRWKGGVATPLAPAEWRQDPLVASSLRTDFKARVVRAAGTTTRVADGKELVCDQLEMSASDTAEVALPHGALVQVNTREISAAVNGEVPFLGLAFASERATSSGRIEPPSPQRRLPPPSVKVETMELLGFGTDARRAFAAR